MQESALPAVSVVMPVFNRAAVVRGAIDSVLAQDFANFELIVVDDGSSDGSADIVAAVKDPRVRLIALPANGGGNAARNRGIREARAPLIAFLDSDDHYLPHKLAVLVRTFGARPEIDVLLDGYYKVHRPELRRAHSPRRNPLLDTNEEVLAALFTRRIWKATPGITVRREAALRAGLFDEGLKRRQDYDFILRLARVARCASTDEILWMKTNMPDAISSDPDTNLNSLLTFYKRHPDHHDDATFRKGFSADLVHHFKQMIAHRGLRSIPRNAWPLVRLFGPLLTAGMMIQGFRAIRTRKRGNRAERAQRS